MTLSQENNFNRFPGPDILGTGGTSKGLSDVLGTGVSFLVMGGISGSK